MVEEEESIGDEGGGGGVGSEGLNAGPVEDDARGTEHEQRRGGEVVGFCCVPAERRLPLPLPVGL